MSKIKRARSSKEHENSAEMTRKSKAPALLKVFYINDRLLQSSEDLRLERFYHPGKGKSALFITQNDELIMEVLEFAEPRRSWLIDNNVCSNGSLYLTTPIDVTFLAVHHLRKHCTQNALALDHICDEQDVSTARLLTKFVKPEVLHCVADVKSIADGDMTFYKYNAEKTLAWLAIKTQRVANALKSTGIHCGHSAKSQNYARSESVADETVQESDYMRMACDIVGGYLDLDLHQDLIRCLQIPTELHVQAEKNVVNHKRKSLQAMDAGENKKLKVSEDANAASKLKTSSLIDDESLHSESYKSGQVEEIEVTPDIAAEIATELTRESKPLKERVPSAKEKALAKGAKGTQSIMSFFKK